MSQDAARQPEEPQEQPEDTSSQAAEEERPDAGQPAGKLPEETLEKLRQRAAEAQVRSGSGAAPAGRRAAVPSDRFDRFTDRAKKVLVLAQEEAQRFNHNYIGTEHLLLGLVRESEGIAAKVLTDVGIKLDEARAAVEFIIGRGDRMVIGDISLTPRSKKVIELAADEARRLNHNYVGTEHLLLGLVREGEGIAAGVLESLGANLQHVRRSVLRVLAQAPQSPEPMPTKDNVVSCRVADADLAAIDMLVEAGIRGTRSEAAQWLIHAGITAHKDLFAKVAGTVDEIRRLRDEARQAAWQVAGDAESLLNTTPSQEPRPAGGRAGGAAGAAHPEG